MNQASNPIYARLTRSAGPPSVRLTYLIGFGVGLVSLAVMVSVSRDLLIHGDLFGLIGVLPLLAPAAYLSLPLLAVVTVVSALVTVRDTSGEDFALMRATPLRGREVAHGYYRAALFRLRLLLALSVALVPVMVVDGFDQMVASIVYLGAVFLPLPAFIPTDIGTKAFIFGALPALVLCAALACWMPLGAAFGVWMGLRWRRMGPAALSLIGLAVVLALLAWGLFTSVYWLVSLLILLGPVPLTAAALRLAARAYDRARS